MKTLNIKLPLSIAQQLDDKAELNAQSIGRFVASHLNTPLAKIPIQEVTLNYSFKVQDDLHRSIKLKAIDEGLAMNELIGRMFAQFY